MMESESPKNDTALESSSRESAQQSVVELDEKRLSDWNLAVVSLPSLSSFTGFSLASESLSTITGLFQPPAFVIPDSDYETKAMDALSRLEAFPVFNCISTLLLQAFVVLDAFECNVAAAKTFKLQLQKVAYVFGQKYYGLAFHAKYVKTPVQATHLAGVEAVVSSAIEYMKRFTYDDYLTHILVSKDPQIKFMEFDQQLIDAVNGVLQLFGYLSSSYLPIASYVVVCDVKPTAEAAVQDIATVNALMEDMGITGADKDSFLRDLDVFNQYSEALREKANGIITNEPHDLIKNVILKDFWLTKLGFVQTVSVAEICNLLREYLAEKGLAAADADTISNNFKSALKILLGISDADFLECLDLAKLVRSVEPASPDVFLKVIEFSVTRCKRILPPVPTIKITWDRGQEAAIVKLLGLRGWVNVEGPKYSGKSVRLLKALHSVTLRKLKLFTEIRIVS